MSDSVINNLTYIYEEWVTAKGYVPASADELVHELAVMKQKLQMSNQFKAAVQQLDRDIDWLNAFSQVWDHCQDTIDRAEI